MEGRCLLQLVMRSAVSTSQWPLLFTVADEVTSGACRLILQQETDEGKVSAGRRDVGQRSLGARRM